MTPRVSVVLATRNRRELLARALQSVESQRFRDFEIIVVDDASIDGTASWLRATHPDVLRVEVLEAGGAAAARNRGVQLARGEIVAFLDDDDAWHPAYLETQVAEFAAHPDIVLCSTGHVEIDATGRVTKPNLRPLFNYANPLVRMLAECPLHTLSVVACRRSVFERLGLFDEALVIVHDLDWYLRLMLAGDQLAHIPTALVERSVPGGLVTRHRLWYAEERAVHARLFANAPIARSDRRRVRAARAVWFARVGLDRADIGFGLARLGEAIVMSPLDCVRIAAARLMQRFGRGTSDPRNAGPLEAQ